jgi:hypothetical protein
MSMMGFISWISIYIVHPVKIVFVVVVVIAFGRQPVAHLDAFKLAYVLTLLPGTVFQVFSSVGRGGEKREERVY